MAYRVTRPNEDEENDSPTSGRLEAKQDDKADIRIRRNPLTHKLEGIPKKWIEKGMCDPKIVEMGKLVESNDDN